MSDEEDDEELDRWVAESSIPIVAESFLRFAMAVDDVHGCVPDLAEFELEIGRKAKASRRDHALYESFMRKRYPALFAAEGM